MNSSTSCLVDASPGCRYGGMDAALAELRAKPFRQSDLLPAEFDLALTGSFVAGHTALTTFHNASNNRIYSAGPGRDLFVRDTYCRVWTPP